MNSAPYQPTKISFLLLSVCLTVLALLWSSNKANAQDLPSPSPNLQTLPANSYIIAMDNTNQKAANGYFNLKTYGFIVYLLNKNIHVRWVITAGKAKDATDFAASSVQIRPTVNLVPTSRSYKDGPFVIFASDTAGVAALADAYYSQAALSGADRPNIFRNITATQVDVRYDLNGFKPRAGILNDGGNDTIHVNYMLAASIPVANYSITDGKNLASGCFTFASEPHNTNQGAAVDTAVACIKRFVLAGGNFLAQCAADSNYENNPLGRFQTTLGMNVTNINIGTTLSYPNPDLSFSQFEGPFLGYDGYSFIQNWLIKGSATNNEHGHTMGSGTYASYNVATAAKLRSGIGGLVFYIGVHSFTNGSFVQAVPVQMNNGIRMYMNAFLTPANLVCGSALPVHFSSFRGTLDQEAVQLQWGVVNNQTIHHFEIEQSLDGSNFSKAGSQFSLPEAGTISYKASLPAAANAVFYRIKMVNFDGSFDYSGTILVKYEGPAQNNALDAFLEGSANLVVNYRTTIAGTQTLSLYSASGARILEKKVELQSGINRIQTILPFKLASGVYLVQLWDNFQMSAAKLVVR